MAKFPTLRLTTWRNPTQKTIKADIFVGTTPDNPGGRIHVEWGPGEEQDVPSEYDGALQKVRAGKVVGGLAPQLVRTDKGPIPVDPAIDAEAAEKRAARSALRDAQALEAAAKVQLAEAATKVAEAAQAKPEAAQKAAEHAPARQAEPEQRRDDRGSQHQNRR